MILVIFCVIVTSWQQLKPKPKKRRKQELRQKPGQKKRHWQEPAQAEEALAKAEAEAKAKAEQERKEKETKTVSEDIYKEVGTQNIPQTDTSRKEQMVWLSETGEKYHNKPDCGRMNPNKARQVTLSEAQKAGYGACSKCY